MHIRKRIHGTQERPRLSVFRSAKHIYGQLINDDTRETIVSAQTTSSDFSAYGGNKQAAEELGTFLARQTFADGTNMLAVLNNDNYIKKFKTKDIVMTYGPTEEGKITLNKLNELIAKEKGVKVSELAVEDDTPKAEAPAKKTAKKTDAKEAAKE